MINKVIIRLASNTSNVGLKNKYSHKISLKNSICGDKITLELIADKEKLGLIRNYEFNINLDNFSEKLMLEIYRNATVEIK